MPTFKKEPEDMTEAEREYLGRDDESVRYEKQLRDEAGIPDEPERADEPDSADGK